MKKILKYGLIFLSSILFFNSIIYAEAFNNKTALSVGVDYGDGTSGVDHATNSYNTYKNMGLTSKLITNTTESNMTGSHNSSTHYLESGIVYLVGHASYMSMTFINGVDIDRTNSNFGANLGIGMYDNSRIAFMTLAGCNTAEDGVNNIAKAAYDYGTNIVLGWKTDLNIGSYKNWNKRFNEIIKDKKTSVLDAAKSASDHIYLSNTVKNYKFYGQYNKNPWKLLNSTTIAMNKKIEMKNKNNIVNTDVNKINSFLKDNVDNINLNNFKLEINGVHETYYDFVLYVNNIRTNLGYTIIENNTDHNLRFVDNMNNLSYNEIVNLIKNSSNTNNNIKSIDSNYLENIRKANNFDHYTILSTGKYFDIQTRKLYTATEVKFTNNVESIITTYLEEIYEKEF